jgi:hypothetical protein
VVVLINNLENLFPVPQAQVTLVRQEAAEIGDKKFLQVIENVAKGVNSLLRTAAQEVLPGHKFLKIVVRSQAQTGNMYSSNWRGTAIGASSQYDSVEVEKGGKALIGDILGDCGKGFWDES